MKTTFFKLAYASWCRIMFFSAGVAFPSLVNAGTTIDVLVVYTARVEKWAHEQAVSCHSLSADAREVNARIHALTGYVHPCNRDVKPGTSADDRIRNLVEIGLQEANDVFFNSGLPDVKLRLKGLKRLEHDGRTYDEQPSNSGIAHASAFVTFLASGVGVPNQLYQLRNRQDAADENGTILERVHAWRKNARADIVLMLVDDRAVDPAVPLYTIDGLAMGVGVSTPRDGFVVVKAGAAITPRFSMAHEIMHLFGADHYGARTIPNLGSIDTLLELPYPFRGEPANHGFHDTVTPDGRPRFDMISDLMAGLLDADGNRIFPKANQSGSPLASHRAWEGSRDAQGACIPTPEPEGNQQTVTMTSLPVLSTLETRFPKPLMMGNAASSDQMACLMLALTYQDGSTGSKLVTLRDADSVPRQAAQVARYYARVIAGFSDRLDRVVDQQRAGVAIDFGPALSLAPGTDYSATTAPVPCAWQKEVLCFWNNITDTQASKTPVLLRDQSGMLNGHAMVIERGFLGVGQLQPAMAASMAYGRDEAAQMALTDYMTVDRRSGGGRITFDGLDSSRRWVFRVFGTTDSAFNYRVARYQLTSAKGWRSLPVIDRRRLGTQNNTSRFVEFRRIKPLHGRVTLSVSSDSRNVDDDPVGLSAVVYFPEP